MRAALRDNRRRVQVSTGKSIPAPVGGWDAQSPIANMKPENAVVLRNWIPRPGYVEMRRGNVQHVLTDDPVESLIIYRGSSPNKIFACAGTDIIDATAEGSAGSTLYSSAGNARWQYVNFSNEAGAWAIAVNGANTPQSCDGSAFADLSISGASGPITLAPADLIDVMAHERRLFFVEKSTLRVWFLAVEAIQGTAQLLDLGPIFSKGGELLCLGTWTIAKVSGPQDMAVFITSEGQVAVYQGIDPSDANNWSLVGVYNIGLPLSRRSLIKYGSDLTILTTDGALPLSQALALDRAKDEDVAFTAMIQNAFATSSRAYRDNFGWEGMLYPRGSLAIINIPTGNNEQYVQNVQTGAWCQFTGMNANCWAVADDMPYFGSLTGVYRWDTGLSDNGQAIVGDAQCAFNYFGQRGVQKQFTMLRPVIRANRAVMPAVEMLTDFAEGVPTSTPTTVIDEGGLWDAALWGVGLWESAVETRYSWTTVTGIGYCGSASVRVSVSSTTGATDVTVQLMSFDVLFQPGGQL